MRSVLAAAGAALLLLLSGCVPQPGATGGHPDLIIIREFAFTPGIVTLDPSFGFSLYRGSAGVPSSERAAGVGRAAAFNVADAMAMELARFGYDVTRSETATAEPGGRALIVTGSFRQINEGTRRRVGAERPGVAVDGEIGYQTGTGAPQRLTTFQLDSRQTGAGGSISINGRRNVDLRTAATQLGTALAHYVATAARVNNWPAAPPAQ